MTDPMPQFVSLVNHGANQTPFAAIKSDDPAVVVANLTGTEREAAMSKKTTQKSAGTMPAGAAVQLYTFPADKFTTESATKYLEDAGYENVKLTEADGAFTMQAAEVADFEGDLHSIEMDDGVVLTVGKLAEADDAGEPAAKGADDAAEETAATPAEPAAVAAPLLMIGDVTSGELAKKYDDWFASYSAGKTLAEVMAEGADGIPPGAWEVVSAFWVALRNALMAQDVTSVRALGAELAETMLALANALPSATLPPELVEKIVGPEALAAPETAAAADTSEVDGADPVITGKGEGDTADDAGADAGTEQLAADEPETPVVKSADPASDPTLAAILDAVTGLKSQVDSLTQKATETATAQEEKLGELTQKVATVSDRVESIETRSQTRKSSHDALDGSDSLRQPVKKRESAMADPLTRASLGFSRR